MKDWLPLNIVARRFNNSVFTQRRWIKERKYPESDVRRKPGGYEIRSEAVLQLQESMVLTNLNTAGQKNTYQHRATPSNTE